MRLRTNYPDILDHHFHLLHHLLLHLILLYKHHLHLFWCHSHLSHVNRIEHILHRLKAMTFHTNTSANCFYWWFIYNCLASKFFNIIYFSYRIQGLGSLRSSIINVPSWLCLNCFRFAVVSWVFFFPFCNFRVINLCIGHRVYFLVVLELCGCVLRVCWWVIFSLSLNLRNFWNSF